MKKLLSFLLALVLMVGTITPVMAANDAVTVPTGKLDEKQLSSTKPEKTKVNLYKLTTKEDYKAGAPWDHTGGKIAPDEGTENEYTSLGKEVKALKGAQFTFYKINGKDNVESEKILALLDKNKDSFKTLDEMNDLIKNGKTGLKASDKDENLTEIAKSKLQVAATTADTDDNGLATVELADGYYWVIESKIPAKITGQIAVPFGLTLPLTNAYDVKDEQDKVIAKAGTRYLKELFIYPKNIETDKVKIDKDHANYDDTTKKWVDKDGNEVPSSKLGIDYEKYQRDKEVISEELGKDRPFQSDTTIPRNYTFDSFSWVDRMSEGLTYNKDLVVTIDYTDADGTNIKKGQPFIDATNKATFVTEKDNGFDIVVKKDQVKDTLVEYLKRGPVTFHFSYSAKVNNNTVVDKPQSNSITFEPGEPGGVPDVKSKEGKIEIVKSWKKDNADVTNPTAKDLTYYVEDQNGKTVASVTVKADATAGTVIQAANGITFTVGANFGSGTFAGLPEGTYKVREAVDGYKPTYTPGNTDGNLTIENNDNPDVKKPSEPTVVFHGKKFVKMDQVGNETRLFGAEFVIRRENADKNGYDYLVIKNDATKTDEAAAVGTTKEALDKKIAEYNALSAEEQKKQKENYDTEIDKLQKAYNDAVIAARAEFEWKAGTGANKDVPPTDAYKLVSDGQGRFEITGLKAGDYELQEITAPVGYALNEGGIKFTVKDGTYKGDKTKEIKYTVKDTDEGETLAKDGYGQRVDNRKLTIPQTGGIGTVIFTVVGIALMAGAFIAMRKRTAEEN